MKRCNAVITFPPSTQASPSAAIYPAEHYDGGARRRVSPPQSQGQRRTDRRVERRDNRFEPRRQQRCAHALASSDTRSVVSREARPLQANIQHLVRRSLRVQSHYQLQHACQVLFQLCSKGLVVIKQHAPRLLSYSSNFSQFYGLQNKVLTADSRASELEDQANLSAPPLRWLEQTYSF
ncbi:hypothetical protein LY76DRAFT_231283 [Colletotrichum caudatum]|nr:hypothetical protein LY76DRAFT_231283 [Colletotrichum caudatum]